MPPHLLAGRSQSSDRVRRCLERLRCEGWVLLPDVRPAGRLIDVADVVVGPPGVFVVVTRRGHAAVADGDGAGRRQRVAAEARRRLGVAREARGVVELGVPSVDGRHVRVVLCDATPHSSSVLDGGVLLSAPADLAGRLRARPRVLEDAVLRRAARELTASLVG